MFRFFRMAEAAAKRLKPTLQIGTHNGHFHADEALAVHMLRSLPTYASASLVRTRDPAVLAKCHTVVDVGGQYDPSTNRYDHHQRSFSTTFPSRPTKLSSAGLVYLHFGKALVRQKLALDEDADAPEVDIVWKKLYESFVEALDAHDNGISAYDPAGLNAAALEKRFSDSGFGLGAMVGRRNRAWNDPVPEDPEAAQADEDERFLAASKRIGEEFDLALQYYAKSWLPAREVVLTAFEKRHQYDPEGRLLVFEGASAPWKDHLYTLEQELAGGKAQVLYVLYPETPAPGAKWRVQAVPVATDSFESRKALPEAWRGFRDEELDKICGVEGCVFVHAAGFIGGNKTFEGAKAMATKALEL